MQTNKNIIFLHISDLHFSFDYANKGNELNYVMSSMPSPLEQIKKHYSKLSNSFDFVLVSGDICEDGSEEEYKFVDTKLKDLFNNVPIYYTLGNHDNFINFQKGIYPEKTLQDTFFQVIKFNNLQIISLNSASMFHNDGFISDSSIELLEKTLVANSTIPTIVMTHHHLIKEQFTLPCANYNTNKLEKALKSGNVLAIFGGHTHHYYQGKLFGIPFYTECSMAFCGENQTNNYLVKYTDHTGCTIYKYDNNQIDLVEHSEDSYETDTVLQVIDYSQK